MRRSVQLYIMGEYFQLCRLLSPCPERSVFLTRDWNLGHVILCMTSVLPDLGAFWCVEILCGV